MLEWVENIADYEFNRKLNAVVSNLKGVSRARYICINVFDDKTNTYFSDDYVATIRRGPATFMNGKFRMPLMGGDDCKVWISNVFQKFKEKEDYE